MSKEPLKSPVFEITLGIHYYALQLPPSIVQPFLDKKQSRVKVSATFEENQIDFHTAIQKRNGNNVMLFGKQYQKALGVFPNDVLELQFFEDDSKYGVEVPEEFEAVLFSDPDAHDIFETLTPGRKRGLIYAIARYRNSQTRIDKTLLLCDRLKRGVRDPRELLKSN